MKTVIQGLEEGLNSIAEALEGSGPSIPTPTLEDESKVLKVIPQTQTTVAPEWTSIREVSIGGTQGQVLTKGASGYDWNDPEKELPTVSSSARGKFLGVNSSNDNLGWKDISQVPDTTGVTDGYVLTNSSGTPTWAAASGGLPATTYAFNGYVLGINQVGSDKYTGWYKPNVNYVITNDISDSNILTPNDEYTFTLSNSNSDPLNFITSNDYVSSAVIMIFYNDGNDYKKAYVPVAYTRIGTLSSYSATIYAKPTRDTSLSWNTLIGEANNITVISISLIMTVHRA